MSFILLSVANLSHDGKSEKALRALDLCKDEKDVQRKFAERHELEPQFDYVTITWNEWFSLDYDPTKIQDVQYDNSELNDIINDYKRQQDENVHAFAARREKERAKKEEGEEAPKEIPNATGTLTAIIHLEATIAERERELKSIKALYNSEAYTDEQRQEAEAAQIQLPEVSPIFNFS
jgi:hypothetical protein